MTNYNGLEVRHKGFSLVELLTVVMLCTLLTTFAIWKVFNSNANLSGKYSYAANQAASMLAAAYQTYRQNTVATVNTQASDIAPYFNYLSVDTSSSIDSKEGAGSTSCSSSSPCYRLHSGGILQTNAAGLVYFCDTTPNSYIFFRYDPDGVFGGTTTGASKSIGLDLHFDGRVVESSQRQASDITCSNPGASPTGWTADPATTWYTWGG